jgi:hypothetical protein
MRRLPTGPLALSSLASGVDLVAGWHALGGVPSGRLAAERRKVMAGRRVATAIGNGPEDGEAHDLQLAPTTAESERIAGLVGPTLVALSASEALNYHRPGP